MQVWTSASRISWGEFFWGFADWDALLLGRFAGEIMSILVIQLEKNARMDLSGLDNRNTNLVVDVKTPTLAYLYKSSETDPTCFSLDSIITIIIQHSESSIYTYLQSMKLVVRKLWCFMIHWFEKKHVAMACLQSSARCVVCFSFVGFSSCVAWWTTMGCESSKRRPEKRDHVSFAANMTRFLNSR